MKLIMYTRENPPCAYCEGAKLFANENQYTYHTVVIGQDVTLEEFTEMFPGERSIPLIFSEDDQGNRFKIGGYMELKEWHNKWEAGSQLGDLSL